MCKGKGPLFDVRPAKNRKMHYRMGEGAGVMERGLEGGLEEIRARAASSYKEKKSRKPSESILRGALAIH